MDSKEELSVLVGCYAWSRADYAPESAFLSGSGIGERETESVQSWKQELVLCVCARSSGARTEIAATKCAEMLSRSIQLFLLTKLTGGICLLLSFVVSFLMVSRVFSSSLNHEPPPAFPRRFWSFL
jgi:hypothetical protein